MLNLLHNGAFDATAELKDKEREGTAANVIGSLEKALKHDQLCVKDFIPAGNSIATPRPAEIRAFILPLFDNRATQ